MSKIPGYICDNCRKIYDYKDVVGIEPVEDMHDKFKSFPIISNPDKAAIHFCLSCFKMAVDEPLKNDIYKETYDYDHKCLSFTFKQAVVLRYNRNIMKKHLHSKKK
jgi:hypothetical protein